MDLQIQPDRSEIGGERVELQLKVLGRGPLEGLVGELAVESGFFRVHRDYS